MLYMFHNNVNSTKGYSLFNENLLDSQFVNGSETAQAITLARTKPYLSGTTSVVGLNLKKYNILAPTIGNGMRVGSAPVECRISRVGIGRSAGNGGAANSLKAPVLLNFFLESLKVHSDFLS